MKIQNISSYGISLTEAKDYLRVENSLEDNFVKTLITGSYITITNECNRDFNETSYTESFDSGSTEFLTSQKVYNLSTGSLVKNSDGCYAVFDSYYTGDVTYKTAVSGSVPENVKVAQLMLISQWFDERSSVVIGASIQNFHYGVASLLQPYQLVNCQ